MESQDNGTDVKESLESYSHLGIVSIANKQIIVNETSKWRDKDEQTKKQNEGRRNMNPEEMNRDLIE